MSKPRKRKPRVKPGPRYSTKGFYVEGRWFGAERVHCEQACAFAASLAAEYQRGVAVETCLAFGHAFRTFLYVPAGSAEALVAQRDSYGHVIFC